MKKLMANRPVSLSVHRNNRAQRDAKRVRSMLKNDVKELAATPGIAGYAVVVWNKDRAYDANWYAPLDGPMPSGAMPDYVRTSLQREICKADTRRIVWPSDDNEAG